MAPMGANRCGFDQNPIRRYNGESQNERAEFLFQTLTASALCHTKQQKTSREPAFEYNKMVMALTGAVNLQ